MRFIIDGKVLSEPRAWQVTKVNRVSPNGIARITLAQTFFDQHRDYIEVNEQGNVIGMWADFFKDTPEIPPDNTVPIRELRGEITYSGPKAQIKAGGSYKKFTVAFYDSGEQIELPEGVWMYEIVSPDRTDIIDASDMVNILSSDDGIVKVKFTGGDSYIGSFLKISYVAGSVAAELDVEIIAL